MSETQQVAQTRGGVASITLASLVMSSVLATLPDFGMRDFTADHIAWRSSRGEANGRRGLM